MLEIASLDSIEIKNAWVSIGSFDGVHRGHQSLLADLVQGARAEGSPTAVITFYPHPSRVLRGLSGAFYLTSPEERTRLIGGLGIDHVITLEFTREMAATPAEVFLARLRDRLGMRRLWVGFNFALGRGREGDIPALTRLADLYGYELSVVPPVEIEGEIVSSSLIRGLLANGEVDRAAHFLGREYSVTGPVVHGDGRGGSIGIPTANLDIPTERVLPVNGVYAGWAWVNGVRHAAVANIGVRPTFDQGPVRPRLEALLLDFNADLYGQQLTFQFNRYLRGEQRFPGVDALIAQIKRDIQSTREVLLHDD